MNVTGASDTLARPFSSAQSCCGLIGRLLCRSTTTILAALLALIAVAPYFPELVERFGRRTLAVDATVRAAAGLPRIVVETEDTRVLGERALLTVPLPKGAEAQKKWRVEISSDGSRNPGSSSSEVWIFGITTPEGPFPLKRGTRSHKKDWQLVKDPRAQGGRLAVSTSSGPKSYSATVTGSSLAIYLLRHSFSGKIRLTVNDEARELDLYAPHDGEIFRLDFGGDPATGAPVSYPRTVSFKVPEPLTGRRTLKIVPDTAAANPAAPPSGAVFEAGAIGGTPVAVRDGMLEIPKGSLGAAARRTIPVLLLAYGVVFALLLLLGRILAPFYGRFFADLGSPEKPDRTPPAHRWAAYLGLTLIGVAATAAVIGVQAVKFGALPLLLLSGIVAFSGEVLPRRCWIIVTSLYALLLLRLPLVGGPALETIHRLAVLAIFVIIIVRVTAAHRASQTTAPLVASVLLSVLCALTHLSILSPYSAVCVIAIWPDQYLTVLDGMVLNGDYPHFVDLFGSYATATHLPGMSVVLRRFFYEYLWSVLSPSGPSWATAFLVNMTLWTLSSSALVLTAHRLTRSRTSCWFAALASGGLVLFTSYAAQPMLYLAAYAWSFILLGATLRYLEAGEESANRPSSFLLFLFAAGLATYDLIPVIVPLICVLAAARRWTAAAVAVGAQLIIPVLWAQAVLLPLAGTLGPDSNRGFISNSIEKWKVALLTSDVGTLTEYLLRGASNLFFASYGIGLLVALWVLVAKRRSFPRVWALSLPRDWPPLSLAALFLLLTAASLLVNFAIAALVAPELTYWSPGFNLPRISAYYCPVALLAASVLMQQLPLRAGVGAGISVVLLSFMDTLGIHGPIMILQYGWWFGTF